MVRIGVGEGGLRGLEPPSPSMFIKGGRAPLYFDNNSLISVDEARLKVTHVMC